MLHSRSLSEEDAGGGVYGVGGGGGGEDSGFFVTGEDGYVVGELAGYDEMFAIGREGVVAGFFAT